FENTNPTGCSPFQVTFTNNSLNNPTSVRWVIEGVETELVGNSVEVVFENAGTYNVQLISTNNLASDTLDVPNFIVVGEKPEADFEFTSNGLLLNFQNNSIGGNTYLW